MLTTVVGFGAMLFAHHQGLRSIALTAVLGVVCCWATVVVLMAGVLRLRERRRRGESLPPPPEPLFESAFGESQIPG
jgi:predicted RND superfamily exporter protein